MIHYYDIEIDYRPFPQVTHNDYAWMDKAFLLYIFVTTQGKALATSALYLKRTSHN